MERIWRLIILLKTTLLWIAASHTPSLGGVKRRLLMDCLTACITNNPGSPLTQAVDIFAVNVGPNFPYGKVLGMKSEPHKTGS